MRGKRGKVNFVWNPRRSYIASFSLSLYALFFSNGFSFPTLPLSLLPSHTRSAFYFSDQRELAHRPKYAPLLHVAWLLFFRSASLRAVGLFFIFRFFYYNNRTGSGLDVSWIVLDYQVFIIGIEKDFMRDGLITQYIGNHVQCIYWIITNFLSLIR